MKILAVDLCNLAFPIFFYTQDRPGVAAANTLRSIKEAASTVLADRVIVCTEGSQPSFRKAIFPAYKEARGAPPEGFLDEIDLIVEGCPQFGWMVLDPGDSEADDALAAIAYQAGPGVEVDILTNDKDLLGCISPRCRIVSKRAGQFSILDREACIAKMGVPPEKVSEYLALVGDTVDGIPGVPGIGPKKALEVFDQYDSVEEALQDPSRLSNRVKRLLLDGAEAYHLCLRLTRLRVDLDLGNYFAPPG